MNQYLACEYSVKNTNYEYCLIGRYSGHSKGNGQESSGVQELPTSQLVRERTETEFEKSCLVEELKLPDIMFYASDNAGK
jgi:hypothetical protein